MKSIVVMFVMLLGTCVCNAQTKAAGKGDKMFKKNIKMQQASSADRPEKAARMADKMDKKANKAVEKADKGK